MAGPMSDPFESDADPSLPTLEFLSGSRHRIEILYLLREEGPATRREVRESVDASRSTVRRALEGFLEREWVASTDDGYRITAAGGLVVAGFRRLSETVRVTDEYAPLLRNVPDGAFDVDPSWLAGGTLIEATEANPYAPAQRQTETVRDAARFRALLPSIELEGARLVHERVVDGDLSAAVVLPPAGVDTVRSEPFAELFREKLATGRFEAFAHEGELPFYLGLPDGDAVEIGCEDDSGIPRALFQSTDAELRAWGEATFERYVDAAEPLAEADF